jgi:hypothetical protein
MKRLLAAAVAVAMLSSHAMAQPNRQTQAKLRAILKLQMLDELKDPDSAKLYREALYLGEDDTTVSLCGEVNARNAMGGYAGRMGFISTSNSLVVFQDSPGAADFEAVWRVWCVRRL